MSVKFRICTCFIYQHFKTISKLIRFNKQESIIIQILIIFNVAIIFDFALSIQKK